MQQGQAGVKAVLVLLLAGLCCIAAVGRVRADETGIWHRVADRGVDKT